MKVELEIDNLPVTLVALNNALIVYGNCSYAASLGAEISEKLQHLSDLSPEELKYRFNCLKNLYEQLAALEVDPASSDGNAKQVVKNEKYNNYRCPRCNGVLYRSNHYCSNCGQKLYWGGIL